MSGTIEKGEPITLNVDLLNGLKNGQVIGFMQNSEYTDHQDNLWFSRIIAQSGETVEIRESEVWVNGTKVRNPPKTRLQWQLEGNKELLEQVKSYLFRDNSQIHKELFLEVRGELVLAFLYDQQVKELRERFGNLRMERMMRRAGYSVKEVIGFAEGEGWNNDHFGPLRIPEVGETVTAEYEGLYQSLGVQKGETFVVEETLYFVLGDNRNNARDSRVIGLVPRSRVMGVVEVK